MLGLGVLVGREPASPGEVSEGAVSGTGHRKACPGLRELQGDQPGLPRRLPLALGSDEGGAGRLSRGPGGAGADQRATRAPAGFPHRTVGQVWPQGQRAAGGWGKPWYRAGTGGPEPQPINLPREMLRGFAFCLANYSASTLSLS